MMHIRKVQPLDANSIIRLLGQLNLPTRDLDICNMNNFYVAIQNNGIIGVGGIEMYDNIALIRSFAIKQEFRGYGIAEKIYKIIEEEAKKEGILRLYLLTETSTQYFEKFGFEIIKRDIAPLSIVQSAQFRNLCPKSAILMQKSLNYGR